MKFFPYRTKFSSVYSELLVFYSSLILIYQPPTGTVPTFFLGNPIQAFQHTLPTRSYNRSIIARSTVARIEIKSRPLLPFDLKYGSRQLRAGNFSPCNRPDIFPSLSIFRLEFDSSINFASI